MQQEVEQLLLEAAPSLTLLCEHCNSIHDRQQSNVGSKESKCRHFLQRAAVACAATRALPEQTTRTGLRTACVSIICANGMRSQRRHAEQDTRRSRFAELHTRYK